MGFELHMNPFVGLIGLTRLADGAHSHLRGEPIAIAKLLIDQRLECQLVGNAIGIGHIGHVLTGTVESLDGLQQRTLLVFIRLKA